MTKSCIYSRLGLGLHSNRQGYWTWFGKPGLRPGFFFKLWVGWVFGLLDGFEIRWINQGLGKAFEILSVRMLALLAGFLDLVWKAGPSARLFLKLWVGWVFGLLDGFETRWMNQGLGKGFEIRSVRMLAWLAGFLDLVWKAGPSARLFFKVVGRLGFWIA